MSRYSWTIIYGGLPFELTEGDIICVFSQYGEIVNINLVRDKSTGRSKGFCFLCYEDQRSTVLAVDNLNGIKLKGRTIRVDHVANYRPPKDTDDIDDITKALREKGCGAQIPSSSSSPEEEEEPPKKKKNKKKKKDGSRRKDRESRHNGKQETIDLVCDRSSEAVRAPRVNESKVIDEQSGSHKRIGSKDVYQEKHKQYQEKKERHRERERPESRDKYRQHQERSKVKTDRER
ncbi:hypothetical protein GDO86_014983 [Hymenochirus boettgeri]|uniref:RRM domain-containing protein n=1 Tax=Hymenochirus boettgeri TaxID=247094 RepID=A0A8T2JZ51_9PIPI|nr:hypothetical protein GDO86_014983 [Hymenochirus boettgeri]